MIVYLDSNAYISAKYIFENNSIGTLKNLVENSKVTVLYTSATIGEVKQHIKDDICAAVSKYNRILRKDLPALCSDSSCALKELNADTSIKDVIDMLDNFLEKDFVEKVSLNPIDVENLMDDYFIEYFIHAIEHHRFIVNIAIECEIEQDDKIISVDSANVLDNTRHKYINLDEDTMYDSDEIDDSVLEEPYLEYCSEYGGLLGRTMNGAYFDLDDNPLCQSCMNVTIHSRY